MIISSPRIELESDIRLKSSWSDQAAMAGCAS